MKVGPERYQEISCIDPKNRDGRSREELILEYAPLVNEIAEKLAIRLPPNISKEELIGPGIAGLFDVLDKFDSKKGIKFRTYAVHRIRGAMLDELRKMDWVSRSVRRDIHWIENTMKTLKVQLNREPEDFEVAEEMGIDIDSYNKMIARACGSNFLSLDELMPGNISTRIANQASGEPSSFDKLQIKELKSVISEAISTLSGKEQRVISLYYYDELTLKEIAEVLDLTESRISQIHSKIIIKLRVKLRYYFEND
jgi:RNA polymerase sigma factor for flagellar operon FliA